MYYVRSTSELTYREGVFVDTRGRYIVTDFDDLTTEIVSYDTVKEVYKKSPDKFINFSVVKDLCSINFLWNDVMVRDNIFISNVHGFVINGVSYYLHPDDGNLVVVSRDKVFSCPMSRFAMRGWSNSIFTLGSFICLLGYHERSKSRILTLLNKNWEYIMTYVVRLGELQGAEFIPLDNEQMDVRFRLANFLSKFIPYL